MTLCKPLFILFSIIIGLYLDAFVVQNIFQQHILGVCAFLILIFLLWNEEEAIKIKVCTCVVVLTMAEITFSLILGQYTYRFDNLPLYIPFAHGVLYFFCIHLMRFTWIMNRAASIKLCALISMICWTISSISWLPAYTERYDIYSLLWFPVAILLFYTKDSLHLAHLFFLTLLVELLGVNFGNWYWSPTIFGVPQGNPPAVTVAGYGAFEFLATYLALFIAQPTLALFKKIRDNMKSSALSDIQN